MICEFKHNIFNISGSFPQDMAMEIFHLQQRENPVYRSYLEAIGILPESIHSIAQLPFLPIRFFKTHRVITGTEEPELRFESSGTTGTIPSRHFIMDAAFYKSSFVKGFELQYGPVSNYAILGLLPSYLERQHSSLVYMVDELIRLSGHPASNFYLYDHQRLFTTLQELESAGQPYVLIGVTFALLDFAQVYQLPLKHGIIMETGGMKGRKEELTRKAVHDALRKAFQADTIHAEYGMTELLSQAYSKGHGIFTCPPWMRILIREEDDPFALKTEGRGIISIVDLANIHSCAFIETEDLGFLHKNGTFEVEGRVDSSEARGCSMMVSNE